MIASNWDFPYRSTRLPLLARNVVATSQPLAAQAGLRMLWAGGNAVDAAIAAAAALTIVEPVSCGLGSDAFAIVWDGRTLSGLNASGRSAAGADPAFFEKMHGGKIPKRGWGAVTVPGAISAWVALSERFGKLPFADLLAPAIELAERGHLLAPVVAHKWAAQVDELKFQPGFAEAFMPHGRAPRAGELFSLPAAGKSLRRIAETRGAAFYQGELAAAMVAHARANGGALAAADFAAHTVDWVTPISIDYRGYTVHEMPPNGQGISALMALGILENFDLASLPVDGSESLHLQIEAMKLAFADTYRHVSDPRAMELAPADLLAKSYLKERALLIESSRAGDFRHGLPPPGGTIYLSAADEQGMMVSFIQSNYMGFGSGVVVPGTGISLQNRGAGFTLEPGHPNVAAGGKRPFHTIIPAFVSRAGQPLMSFGVMGGNMQPQGHVQTLVRMLDYRQNVQAACDAPRWKVNFGLGLEVETAMTPATIAGLVAKGHKLAAIADPYMDFGAGQFILRSNDAYIAASDPRRDGQAVGY